MYKPRVEAGIRKMNQLPVDVECNTCALGGDCDEYKPGAVCYYGEHFKALPIRDADTHIALVGWLAQQDLARTQRALMQEALLAGGQIDPRVSQQITHSLDTLDRYREVARISIEPPSFHASVTMRGGQQPGILSRIFGGGNHTEMPNEPARGPVIDVEPE